MTLPNERDAHPYLRLGWNGPTERPTLDFTRYMPADTRMHGLMSADFMSRVTSWASPTNFRFGTCGPCSVANLFIAFFMYALNERVTVSDQAIFDLYRRSGNPTFNPLAQPGPDGQVPGDNGVDTAIMLKEMESGAGIEITRASGAKEMHRIAAYGQLSGPDMVAGLRSATALFGGAIIGVYLELAQQHQTVAKPPIWTDIPSSPPWGGHDVFGGSFTGYEGDDEQVISWLIKVGVSDGFIRARAQEIFVAIPDIALHFPPVSRLNWSKLSQDFEDLTGRQMAVPL